MCGARNTTERNKRHVRELTPVQLEQVLQMTHATGAERRGDAASQFAAQLEEEQLLIGNYLTAVREADMRKGVVGRPERPTSQQTPAPAQYARQLDTATARRRRSEMSHQRREAPDGIQLTASNPNALFKAVKRGDADLVQHLLQRVSSVQNKDKFGQTALSIAAEHGHVGVVAHLLRSGADVNAKDNFGRSALSYAAQYGHDAVVTKLLEHCVDVEAKDNYGRTALSWSASFGHANVVSRLLECGALVDAEDGDGRTALSWAAAMGCLGVIRILLRHGAGVNRKENDGRSSLSWAAQSGNEKVVANLIEHGAAADVTDNSGRTPLFHAAEYGHDVVVKFLIENGASVTAKSNSTSLRRECVTPLTLAGRAGHMKIFQGLIEAGAAVNVRSDDGETPLISAARWDYVAGVQLAVSSGGCLQVDKVAEDEYPLIPGTLETMKKMCRSTFEFESMCASVVERLSFQLQIWNSSAQKVQQSTVVSFASIIFRVCRLLFDIEKRESPLVRFIGSRAITGKVRNFHEELDHSVGLADVSGAVSWKNQYDRDVSLLQMQLQRTITPEGFLGGDRASDAQKFEAAVLLQHELEFRDGDQEMLDGIKRVRDRFLQVNNMTTPTVPEWFVSRDDMEFHSWNAVRTEGRDIKVYEGKWRKSSVMIATSDLLMKEFVNAASQWYPLSHPHVVKLFGACHLESSRFFVYESVPGGKQLHHFLSDDANREWTWKCLYEAALGLQYLHSVNVVHGDLRGENIVVDSSVVTRLCGVGVNPKHYTHGERDLLNWMAPEILRKESSASVPADIYALGMCIWEAVTLELPWQKTRFGDVEASLKQDQLPERHPSIGDSLWDLIKKMCRANPNERTTITYVVNRMKQLVRQSAENDEPDPRLAFLRSTEASKPIQYIYTFGITESRLQSLNEHHFAELEDTIPNTLRRIVLKCETFSEDPWMAIKVRPALEHIFALLVEREKTPSDVEVVQFCTVLCRFQRYLRTAISKNSLFRNARSRKVAETHRVIYADLDRLLDLLDVPDTHQVRRWRNGDQRLVERGQAAHSLHSAASSSYRKTANQSSNAVSLKRFGAETPTSCDVWTFEGMRASATLPAWYLSLSVLRFNESVEIGRGSFGTVCLGLWLDTVVVVKFMGYEEDYDTIPTDLLLHEVRVWHRLNHPHVLKFYGACHIDKRYFVCEYASNGDLMDFLSKPGNESLVWQKMYEAALGLQYLHSQNVAHNDLKCDNIMVGMDGNAKLIDFGLSSLLNEAEIQIDVKQMGAVNWRSPEYLAGERPSFASDVYSFAMCIIEAVSGEVPWGKNTPASGIRYQIKKRNTANLPTSMTEKQKSLVHLMTKFDPAERVKMGFVVDKLNEIAQDQIAKKAPE